MAQDLRIDRSEAGSFLKVEVSGTLNEALVPEQLAGIGDGRPIRIDLEKVSRITSFGVRQWVRGLEALRLRSGGLVLERCSYACVSQLNLISTFSADALIVSVMAPVRCEACEHERLIVVDVTKGPPGSLEQPCVMCGAKADLEEDPETYFAFAKTRALTNGLAALYEKLQADAAGVGQEVQATPVEAQPTAAAKTPQMAQPEGQQTAALDAQRKAAAETQQRAAAEAQRKTAAEAKARVAAEAQAKAAAEVRTKREAEEEALAQAQEKAEEAARIMSPPPPPAEENFEIFEATQVHTIEDVADFMRLSELARQPAPVVEAEALPAPPGPVVIDAEHLVAVDVDGPLFEPPMARWLRKPSTIAMLAFGLGLLVGFLLGRL
ncbi:MAG: hypothetical protein ACAI38_09635 [Myxococcota bacterium]|nr:hypothetical protein [Myxococcota bacterium]